MTATIKSENSRREKFVKHLLRYDAFRLTQDVLASLTGDKKGYLHKSELKMVGEYLPVVEPLFSTIHNLRKKKWKIERAKNLVEATQQTMVHHISKAINGKYRRVLTMGLPTLLEKALKGAENVEVRCIHPTFERNEIAGFVERCVDFFNHTSGNIVHLAQCTEHIDWADGVFLDSFGAWFSVFVREGTDMVTRLAYDRKPLFLLMADGSQWSDRDLYGLPVAPDNFQFLLTENGLFQYTPSENPLKERWTFSKI